jgi:predicted RNA-binding Zn-ribbon protein involved in translation (DUF1610 family)
MKKPKLLNAEEDEKLSDFYCPDCGERDILIFGEQDGIYRNAICGGCKTEYRRSAVMTERIGQPCSEERQREVYRLHRWPVADWNKRTPMSKSRLIVLPCSGYYSKNDNKEMWFHSMCHPHAGLDTYLDTGTSVLHMFCGKCRRPVLKLQI